MKVERFIELYNELEIDIRRVYNLKDYESPISYYLKEVLTNKNSQVYEQLDQIRKIRNLLVHGTSISSYIPFTLEDSLEKDLYYFIDKVNNFSYAKSIMTSFTNLKIHDLDSRVMTIVDFMSNNHFSYIPIIENKKFIGIFSKDSCLELIKNQIAITNELRIKDIEEYIRLNLKELKFVNEYELLEDIAKIFNSKKKIKYIIVTTNGTINGEILGVISPIDIYKGF